MVKGVRSLIVILSTLALSTSFLLTGCNRAANEEQMTTLEETQGATLDAESNVVTLEKEKAELEAKLAEKKAELETVKQEKGKLQEGEAE